MLAEETLLWHFVMSFLIRIRSKTLETHAIVAQVHLSTCCLLVFAHFFALMVKASSTYCEVGTANIGFDGRLKTSGAMLSRRLSVDLDCSHPQDKRTCL